MTFYVSKGHISAIPEKIFEVGETYQEACYKNEFFVNENFPESSRKSNHFDNILLRDLSKL